jgi:hypothetical protein
MIVLMSTGLKELSLTSNIKDLRVDRRKEGQEGVRKERQEGQKGQKNQADRVG